MTSIYVIDNEKRETLAKVKIIYIDEDLHLVIEAYKQIYDEEIDMYRNIQTYSEIHKLSIVECVIYDDIVNYHMHPQEASPKQQVRLFGKTYDTFDRTEQIVYNYSVAKLEEYDNYKELEE